MLSTGLITTDLQEAVTLLPHRSVYKAMRGGRDTHFVYLPVGERGLGAGRDFLEQQAARSSWERDVMLLLSFDVQCLCFTRVAARRFVLATDSRGGGDGRAVSSSFFTAV